VFDGRIIKTSQKVLTRPEDTVQWIRNHQHGYTFRQLRTPPGHAAEVAAIGAVAALGLVFGAVDILVADDGRVYVLEVNTGPGLVPHGLRVYAEQFAGPLGIQDLNTTVLDEMDDTDEEEYDG
jgi:glutathione synthase/RimK-type ligase-like ATP-grasp enzyme